MNETNPNPDPNPELDALHDQLIDQALRETLGGAAPPDLSAPILARVANAPQPQETTMADSSSRARRWLTYAVAASVLFCLGVLARPAIDQQFVRSDNPVSIDGERPEAELHQVSLTEPSKRETLQRSAEPVAEVAGASRKEAAEGTESEMNGPQSTSSGAKPFMVGVGVNSDSGIVTPDTIEAANNRPSTVPATPSNATVGAGDLAGAQRGYEQQMPSPYYLKDDVQYYAPAREPGRVVGRESNGNGSTAGESPEAAYDNTALDIDAILTFDVPGAEVPASVPGVVKLRIASKAEARDQLWSSMDEAFGSAEELRRRTEAEPTQEGQGPGNSGDKYAPIHENPFIAVDGLQALSTFSIDVDTASYSNVRQFLSSGSMPPPDAVRLEELINYFDYQYEPPTGEDTPFAAHVEVAGCPWNAAHRLVRVGIKGREVALDKRPLTNLVFLIDVSGSMQDAEKLPLVIEGMKALTRQLGENDRVAVVVYASSEGLALPSTPGDQQDKILAALDRLSAGGSTAGGAGIQLAYQIAEDNKITGGVNRVILCTDGDFNVGTTSTGDLERLVTEKANQTGVFLSVCGFGRGNLNDAMMETISNNGNGNYYYVDSRQEAEKVFVKGLTGTLITIAKDVKIQVEFNPNQVAAYRLLGYENRVLAAQDFNDDKKDAGEIGAGHTVTALYELAPAGEPAPTPAIDDLRYQKPSEPLPGERREELLTLKMRYKLPDGDVSTKREWPVTDSGHSFGQASPDMQFASAVAGFGMLLRDSQYRGDLTWEAVREIAQPGIGDDPNGYRKEFVSLVDRARQLRPTPQPAAEAAAPEAGDAPEPADSAPRD